MRILLAGFLHETNTFAASRADDAAFAHGGGYPPLCRGEALFDELGPGVNMAAAGFIEAASAEGDEIVPLLWAAACPSGFVTRDTYERLAGEIVEGIRAALPADAIFLDLHGAMVAEHAPDGEGTLLERVRAVAGDEIPVIVSLDLHANVSERMVALADALLAFRTYPHVDMAETGRRAHALLQRRVAHGRPFEKAMHRIPYLKPICWQSTDDAPAKGLYERVAALEGPEGAVSVSYTMGFPAADIACCSPVVWAYGETPEQAAAAADAMNAAVLGAEESFRGPLYEAEAAVAQAKSLNAEGIHPVIIADAQDNPGAGGSSDTTGLLRALVAQNAQGACLGILHDPEAARAAHAAGVGAEIRLALGGRSPAQGDSPFEALFTVDAVSDGRLRTSGPYYGMRNMELGLSACLRIGGVRIAVGSQVTQLADREMFRFLGIEPETENIVVVKSAIHFRADFRPIAGEILTALAPGEMMMRATDWTWRNLPEDLRLMPNGPTVAEQSATEPG